MKPPPPPLPDDPDDIPDIRTLSEEELAKVQHTVKKWYCCALDCKRFTKVRDFGNHPHIRWRDRWINLRVQIFFCARHSKLDSQKLAGTDWAFPLKPDTELNELG